MALKILENKIRCKHCGDIIISNDFYTFIPCKCGKVAVSGENKMLARRGEYSDYEELTEVEFDGERMTYREAVK